MASKYDEYGFTRYTISLDKKSKETLEALAKNNKLTQSEVLSILLEQDFSYLADVFQAKRVQKLQQRKEAKDISAKLNNLTPEQIAEINRVIGK